MSIFYICGKPGGGKSYLAVKQICEELKAEKGRNIVTNVALNLPELAVWCHKNIEREVNLSERVRILDDEEAGEFWLYEPHHKYENRKTIKRGRGTMEIPDFEGRGLPGTLYVIDEVHNYFGAREWQATGSDCTWFLSQHRKMLCDVILITQHPEQTDKALRRLAQEYMTVRNLSREPVFGFRIANYFRFTRTLNSPLSPNPGPIGAGYTKLDAEEYGKLYDTMAGVGIAGRIAPTNEQRGIHWYWLGVPVVLVVSAFIWLYTHLGYVSEKMHDMFVNTFMHVAGGAMAHPMIHVSPPAAVMPASSRNTSSPVEEKRMPADPPGSFSVAQSQSALSFSATNGQVGVYCTGYIDAPDICLVFLSDGRIADAKCGDVQLIRVERVRVFGEDFDVHTTAQIARDNPDAFYVWEPVAVPQDLDVRSLKNVPAAAPYNGVITMRSSDIPSSPVKLSATAPRFAMPGQNAGVNVVGQPY